MKTRYVVGDIDAHICETLQEAIDNADFDGEWVFEVVAIHKPKPITEVDLIRQTF